MFVDCRDKFEKMAQWGRPQRQNPRCFVLEHNETVNIRCFVRRDVMAHLVLKIRDEFVGSTRQEATAYREGCEQEMQN